MDKKLLIFILVGLLAIGVMAGSGKGVASEQSWNDRTDSTTYSHSGDLDASKTCTVRWTISFSGTGSVTLTALSDSKTVEDGETEFIEGSVKAASTTADIQANIESGRGSYDLDVSVTNCVEDKPKCTTHSSSGCKDGDVYWKDSCGTWEDLKQDCKADETCKSGVCETNAQSCTSHASYACKQGTTQIWWKDSCGAWEALKQDCGAAGCSGQTCNSVQQDTCTSKGFKCCSACATGTEKSEFYLNCKPKFCCSSCALTEENTCSDNWGRDHKGDSKKESGTFQACCDGSWETIVVNK